MRISSGGKLLWLPWCLGALAVLAFDDIGQTSIHTCVISNPQAFLDKLTDPAAYTRLAGGIFRTTANSTTPARVALQRIYDEMGGRGWASTLKRDKDSCQARFHPSQRDIMQCCLMVHRHRT